VIGLLLGGTRQLGGAEESRTAVREELLEETDRTWTPVPPLVGSPESTTAQPAVSGLRNQLNAVVLPEIRFDSVELGVALEALATASAELGADGFNLVVRGTESPPPRLTLSLRNLPLGRVLDLLTTSIDYAYDVDEDAIVLRPASVPAPVRTTYLPVNRSALLQLLGPDSGSDSDIGNRLMAFLEDAGVDFAGTPGSRLAFDGAGIFVTQSAENQERIEAILARYGEIRQVTIEARFLEVQEGVLEELGVTWELGRRGGTLLDQATGLPLLDATGQPLLDYPERYATAGVLRTLSEAFDGAQSSNAILIDGERVASTQPSRLPGTASLGTNAGSLARLTGIVGEFDVDAVVRALAQRQGADLLSAPRLTVLSGETASITVAQEMRYPQSFTEIQSQVGSTAGGATGGSGSAGVTITAGTPQDFATRNVGVELHVTPHVEADGRSISLDLNPVVTDFDGFMEYGGPSLAISAGRSVTVPPGFYQPIFSVRELETQVTVWDGATLIMGGLTREEAKEVEDRIPLLGDIPGLGQLFRSRGESTQKRVLLIFVTAHLVGPGGGRMSAEPGD